MILDEIVSNKRQELEIKKREVSLETIQKMAREQARPLDMATALSGNKIRLIAEVKKASPSRGIICQDFNPVEIARTYAQNGAGAISVLTESRYFQGSPDYLSDIGRALGNIRPPLLRKDFIYDPYQIYESRAYGADALLLITAILTPEQLKELLDLSHRLGMKCLVEVHDEKEIEVAIGSGAAIIGINNRDLRTFKVDIETTARLRPLIPAGKVIVSESGIKHKSDIEYLRKWGVNAALIGETLMTSPDISLKMKELLS